MAAVFLYSKILIFSRIEEINTNSVKKYLKYKYFDDKLYGFNYNEVDYYYLRNTQGDITSIIDRNGIEVARYTYDAWGNHVVNNLTEDNIGDINPFRYRGYYYDKETQLYYLNARYYDPEVGRFISQDNISYLAPETINGLNLYAYCGNNPVMFVDPEGHFALSILLIGLLVGAAIGGGFEIANQVGSKGWNLGDWDWGKIVNHTLVGGAIGLAGAAGVVFLGPIIAGTAAVGAGKTALIALGVTTVISFVAGAGGYAIEESMNGRKVDFGNAIGHGSIVVLESIWSFGVGGIVGSIGKIGTKGPFLSKEWIWKLIFTQEFTQPFKIPMDLIRKYLF